MPVVRSASTARRAARPVGYVLVSVVMEMPSVVSRVAGLAARIMRTGGCGAFAVR
jgi:hypothetical protein